MSEYFHVSLTGISHTGTLTPLGYICIYFKSSFIASVLVICIDLVVRLNIFGSADGGFVCKQRYYVLIAHREFIIILLNPPK